MYVIFFLYILSPIVQSAVRNKCVEDFKKQNADDPDLLPDAQIVEWCQKKETWAEEAEKAPRPAGAAGGGFPGAPSAPGFPAPPPPPPPPSDYTPNQSDFFSSLGTEFSQPAPPPAAAPPPPGNGSAGAEPPKLGSAPMVGAGGRAWVSKKVIRKEYRTLTIDERRRYHQAIVQMKTKLIDGKSQYDILASHHVPAKCPGAHFGPAFLPFHREFLKRYEHALRSFTDTVGLPYWDSSLDDPLPVSSDSIIWSDQFMGTPIGPISIGPFANWSAPPLDNSSPPILTRNVGGEANRTFYTAKQVAQILVNMTRMENFSSCVNDKFEMMHGGPHSRTGGHMSRLGTAAYDPLFWMHHCFIDYLWEQFRQTHQSPDQREVDYADPPESCKNYEFHQPWAIAQPLEMRNVDGLSEEYTKKFYTYAPRPVCNKQMTACEPNSQYLFCAKHLGQCVSKVKWYGNCAGFEAYDVCYWGKCKLGRCQ